VWRQEKYTWIAAKLLRKQAETNIDMHKILTSACYDGSKTSTVCRGTQQLYFDMSETIVFIKEQRSGTQQLQFNVPR
jgi:hypothetical protein